MIKTENTKIYELKQTLGAREKALTECQNTINRLTIRKAEIESNLENLEQSIADATEMKERALDAYVRNESVESEGALRKAGEALDLAKKTKTDAEDMLRAVHRNLREYHPQLQQLRQSVEGGRHKLWVAISEDLGNEARGKVSFLIEQAWVCRLKGAGASYDVFIKSIFPQPSLERVLEIRKEMDTEG